MVINRIVSLGKKWRNLKMDQFEDKMKKSINALAEEYGTIRAGRANPHVLD